MPPSVIKKLNSIHVRLDEPLNLVAKVDGHPLPDCKWYLNDEPIVETENRKMSTEHAIIK